MADTNEKLNFSCDYLEGAHERILKRLSETNFQKMNGYGYDPCSESARARIREACSCPKAEVQFLIGGTQANAVMIDAMLQSYQGVISASSGDDRKNRLASAGYDCAAVQKEVNRLLSGAAPAKSVEEIVREVLAGKWGNGYDRKNRLAAAGYSYTAVQAKVNELARTSSAVYYTIQRGDTLSAVARKYGTTVPAIQKLNSSLIKNVNLIQAG